mmetsp:Transcript_46634/g.101590  ORF Transcript_46634/g.101590 Transcript_46634/m.101590 type:complete len:120 (+) Transcript_46634:282-641(+)
MMSPRRLRTGNGREAWPLRRSKGIPRIAAFRRILLPGETGEMGDFGEMGECRDMGDKSVGEMQPGNLACMFAWGERVPRIFGLPKALDGANGCSFVTGRSNVLAGALTFAMLKRNSKLV